MSKYEEQIRASLENNAKLVADHGPGLYKDLRSHIVAKCPTGKHLLIGGLGGMGIGQMWSWSRDNGKPEGKLRTGAAEIWDQLPTMQCCDFGISDACVAVPAQLNENCKVIDEKVYVRLAAPAVNGCNVIEHGADGPVGLTTAQREQVRRELVALYALRTVFAREFDFNMLEVMLREEKHRCFVAKTEFDKADVVDVVKKRLGAK